jgi:hypothetical protein
MGTPTEKVAMESHNSECDAHLGTRVHISLPFTTAFQVGATLGH